MRYLPAFLYVAVTALVILMSISDYFFGAGDGKRTLARIGLAMIWPLVALSTKGRELLFKQGEGL